MTAVDEYYLGLDLGSGSVGWAVTDREHALPEVNGHPAWGVNLFDEGRPEKERGRYRRMRRCYSRRHERLKVLRGIFRTEMNRVDPDFFRKMDESMLHAEDRSHEAAGAFLRSADFYRRFPTVYHLRKHLMETDTRPDIRLFYMAVHNLVKKTGHFINPDSSDGRTDFAESLRELSYQADSIGSHLSFPGTERMFRIMSDPESTVRSRKAELRKLVRGGDGKDAMVSLLSGSETSLKGLSDGDGGDIVLSLSEPLSDDAADRIRELFGPEILRLVTAAKHLFDSATLAGRLRGFRTLSDMKIDEYEKHKIDLRQAKDAVRTYAPDSYRGLFRGDDCMYRRYTHGGSGSGTKRCSQEEFCKSVLRSLRGTGAESDASLDGLMRRLESRRAFPRQRSAENVMIPNSLHRVELKAILDNMSRFYPFLNEDGGSGLTNAEEVMQIQKFRIPYYVGPLDTRSENSWVIRRSNDHVLPWNFDDVIDRERSAEAFMMRQTYGCRRIPGESALPKNSFLYSYFVLYNAINAMEVCGERLSCDLKRRFVHDVFENGGRTVTLEDIKRYFSEESRYIGRSVYVSGITYVIQNPLMSLQVLRRIIGDKVSDTALCEDIIRTCTVFRESEMIGDILEKRHGDVLDGREISELKDVHFTGWGNYSEMFLTGLYETERDSGRRMNIMELMEHTQYRLDELLGMYDFDGQIRGLPGQGTHADADRYLSENNTSSMTNRTLHRMLAVVRDIVRHMGRPPSRIFIEQTGIKGGDCTMRRKAHLQYLYRRAKEKPSWAESLGKLSEADLRNKSLYLYYTQLGRCMYCGRRLKADGSGAIPGSDRDHIHPRSLVRDDSVINNMVLTCKTCNRTKGDRYPLDPQVVERMRPMWVSLHDKGYISDTKFFRLVGTAPVARVSFSSAQVSETGRAVKQAVKILNMEYGSTTEIACVSGESAAEYRQINGMVKCRSVNDLHHAQDAYLCILAGNSPDGGGRTFTETERAAMRCRDVRYTRNLHLEHGQLFRDNLYPAGEGSVERKRGMDITRYGGYRNTVKSYYSLVEYRVLKHTVRSIEPVESYGGVDPKDSEALAAYHSGVLGREVRVLVPCIKTESTLDWGGMRLTLRGTASDRLLFRTAEQLVLPDRMAGYCRRLYNYDRDSRGGSIINIRRYGLSAEENAELYDHMTGVLSQTPYAGVMATTVGTLKRCRSRFMDADLRTQARVLNQVLRITQCNPSYADLREIGGASVCGRVMLNRRLPKPGAAQVYLVNQSPSGLSENRVLLNGPGDVRGRGWGTTV